MMKRRQNFKLQPCFNSEQQRQMRRFVDSCLYVFNQALALQKTSHERGEKNSCKPDSAICSPSDTKTIRPYRYTSCLSIHFSSHSWGSNASIMSSGRSGATFFTSKRNGTARTRVTTMRRSCIRLIRTTRPCL